jgi:hypothetical protein
MKKKLKSAIKAIINSGIRLLILLPSGAYFFQQLLEIAMERIESVRHSDVTMRFTAPNILCRYRVSTFSYKEPETLEWINNIPLGSVMWDIGANIGLYSIYAAISRGARVLAFEPSVFNLELLARNILLNKLQHQIVILPLALSSQAGPSLFRMSTTNWGGALSTFGEKYGQDGKTLASLFEYQTCGMRMDDVCAQLGLDLPRHIKIDVDGIEHLILSGGAAVLKQAESLLVEINDDFPQQAEQSSQLLKQAGLMLHRKCALNAGNQYNQWWVRKST